ncbi:MAG: Fic family protein [Chloroflexi bacterium]|nr:Fic family protein [Chloroflexota bacterium]
MALLKQHPPKIDVVELFTENAGIFTRMSDPDVVAAIQHANHLYLYWDQFRYRPMPEGITPKQLWGYLHFQRRLNQRPVVLTDTQGRPFTYWLPDRVLQILNKIDRWSGETIGTDQPGGLPPRERYVISSLMEEAIASSQLEGAATTRQMAKQMLRSGRKPRNHHEQMIYNNWITVQYLRANRAMRLTPESLCEIHAMITEETMKDPKDSGRIRTRDDIVVDYCGETVHHPPPSMLLPQRVEALCDFANNDEQDRWIHPVIKATILHFWIGYDHPFVDGNSRTARAIFYWYLLSRGYWLFRIFVYLTIFFTSTIAICPSILVH